MQPDPDSAVPGMNAPEGDPNGLDAPIINEHPSDPEPAPGGQDDPWKYLPMVVQKVQQNETLVSVASVLMVLVLAFLIYKCTCGHKHRINGYSRKRLNDESDYDSDDIEKYPLNDR